MPRGGHRPGSGRKPGNSNRMNEEARQAALSDGISPLDYMLGVMRNAGADLRRRDDMAKAAAPYLHARLTAIEHTGKDGGPIEHAYKLTDSQLEHIAAGSGAGAATAPASPPKPPGIRQLN